MENKIIAFFKDGKEIHYVNCYFGGGYFDKTEPLTVDLEVFELKSGKKFINEHGRAAKIIVRYKVLEYRDNKDGNNTCIIN